jgi:hypothetical protein
LLQNRQTNQLLTSEFQYHHGSLAEKHFGVSRLWEGSVTAPFPPRPSKGEVRWGVVLLCAEGGEEETKVSLEAAEDSRTM